MVADLLGRQARRVHEPAARVYPEAVRARVVDAHLLSGVEVGQVVGVGVERRRLATATLAIGDPELGRAVDERAVGILNPELLARRQVPTQAPMEA
jgi:hypothetical protein